jgi:hypothetical protein
LPVSTEESSDGDDHDAAAENDDVTYVNTRDTSDSSDDSDAQATDEQVVEAVLTNLSTGVVADDNLTKSIEGDSLRSIPGPPSGFVDAPPSSTSSSASSSDDESDVKNVASNDTYENDANDVDARDDDDDDMLAQRGPAVPVLAGPMKFSIGSYKDRLNREKPEPIKILDTRCQCYKTFCGCKSRLFIIS